MNPTDLATITSAVIAVLAAAGTILGFIAKHWIREQLAELRPNGGGSTYDVIRKVSLDTQRAADAAERAADAAAEAHQHIEEVLNRVSNLEQAIVAMTHKRPVRKTPAA